MPSANPQLPLAIIEAYNGYIPPRHVRSSVEKLLHTVPPKYLVGLDRVVLTNFSAEPRKERVGKTKRAGKKILKAQRTAYYHPRSRSSPPYIQLYVDKVLARRKWYLDLPVLRESWLGLTLFHELGHHVHFTQRPEHRGEELVADQWRDRFLKHFIWKRYWYLVPFLAVGARLIRVAKFGASG